MSSSVTAPRGMTPSNVAAFTMRLRSASGPRRAGAKASGTGSVVGRWAETVVIGVILPRGPEVRDPASWSVAVRDTGAMTVAEPAATADRAQGELFARPARWVDMDEW